MAASGNTVWTIDGYRILLNGSPFYANGVSYSPVPWGTCTAFQPYGDFTIAPWSTVWSRDVALMRANSVNLLKTYNTLDRAQLPVGDIDHGPFLDACWNGGQNPVFVLMGYAPPKNQQAIFLAATWSAPANVAARQAIATDLAALAASYAGYPAVMGIVMANEINANNIVSNPDFFAYWNDVSNAMAAAAPGKLTVMANVDDGMITVQNGADAMTAPNFFWGYNSYRGNWTNSNGFDVLFSTFQTATQSNPKPLMLTEWGAPASTHSDYPASPSKGQIAAMSAAQMTNLSTYATGHYTNMLANRSDTGGGVCCGGAYFEWTDEWWKADPIACNMPNAAPACYTGVWNAGPNMTTIAGFPGGYWDEEGFGLYGIAPVDPQNRQPVVPGGCVGPWNPVANAPYAPDTLTARAHANALFALFKANPPGG